MEIEIKVKILVQRELNQLNSAVLSKLIKSNPPLVMNKKLYFQLELHEFPRLSHSEGK